MITPHEARREAQRPSAGPHPRRARLSLAVTFGSCRACWRRLCSAPGLECHRGTDVGRSATTALATIALGVVVVLGGSWFLNNTRPGLELKCRLLNDAGACLLVVLTQPAQPGDVSVPAPFDPGPAKPATPEPTPDPAIALAAAVRSADQDVQSALSSLRDEISSLGDEPSGMGDGLASMKDDLGTVKEDLATTRSEYSDSSQDSGTICSDAATVSSDVATLESDLATIESDGASLESSLVTFDQAVDELRGAASSLEVGRWRPTRRARARLPRTARSHRSWTRPRTRGRPHRAATPSASRPRRAP